VKRTTFKLLFFATLAAAFVLLIPGTMSGAVSHDASSSLTGHSSGKASKRKISRKNKATAVLREYLPEYADILEAEDITLEKAFFTGDLLVPVPADFDPRSPFIFPHLRIQLLHNIDDWLGTRYRLGGRSKRGIDCSAFTSTIMEETLNEEFRGTSRWQARQFTPIFDPDSLQFGDLMFFSGTNRRSKRIGHVGIYIGNGVFAHSSSSRGVTYSHITDGYYTRRFRWGGRFILEDGGDAEKAGVYVLP
jgi:hypothetical protein